MTLVDRDILGLIESKVLLNADSGHVGSISYDLRTKYYVQKDNDFKLEYQLAPGESVFVACEEIVHMPDDMVGRIILRNSRIRAGLMLDAPVYQPGHKTTLFFRITNVSEQSMRLSKEAEFASIMFEQLDHAPVRPYDGVFQQELDFANLGAYAKKYKLELQDFEDKTESIRNIEKSIYGNVITLMTVFIALFSLININIDLAYAEAIELGRMIVFNLTTIGSIAFLVALIRLPSKRRLETCILIGLSLLLFAVSIFLVLS